jgi:hypothetical protein
MEKEHGESGGQNAEQHPQYGLEEPVLQAGTEIAADQAAEPAEQPSPQSGAMAPAVFSPIRV